MSEEKEKFPKIKIPFPCKRPKFKTKGIGKGPGVIGAPTPSGDSGGSGAPAGGGMGESTEDKFTYKYSCAMLPLSDNITPIFKHWVKKMIPTDSLYVNEMEGMSGYENDPHVTIKYGLHDTSPENLEKLSAGFGEVDLIFSNVTKFTENPKFDVLKVDVISDKLLNLNEQISKNMDYTDTFDQYKPHATLAFVKKGTCEDIVGNNFFTDLKDIVNKVYFTSRTGEEYYIDL